MRRLAAALALVLALLAPAGAEAGAETGAEAGARGSAGASTREVGGEPVELARLGTVLGGAAQVTPPGALVTPTGQVVPIRYPAPTGWFVTTVCNNEAFLTQGTVVPQVDVLLDPGHGGSESGSAGANGLIEKNLNLTVAFKVEAILEQEYGLTVQLTRTTDVRVPLRVRAAIAEALRPDVFVSIHHNGGATARRSSPGTEVYHQISSSESRRLAGILYEEITAALSAYPTSWVGTGRRVSSRLRGDGTDLYGVLRNAPNVTSVITEALYLSNPPEARLLADPQVQDAEARAIARGIVRFLTTSDPGSGFTDPFVDEATSGTGGVEGCRDPDLGSPDLPVYTGYTEDDMATIQWAAGRLGMDVPTFLEASVFVVDFLRGLRGWEPEPDPVGLPSIHGPILVTTTWSPTERPVLERTAAGYRIGLQEAQRLSVGVLAFLVGLSG